MGDRSLPRIILELPASTKLYWALPHGLRSALRRPAVKLQLDRLARQRGNDTSTRAQRIIQRRASAISSEPEAPKPITTRLSLSIPAGMTDFAMVSVDFWDTIVSRTRPAESVKRLSALKQAWLLWSERNFRGSKPTAESLHKERLVAESNFFNEGVEPRLAEVFSRMESLGALSESADFLAELELNDEVDYTFVNPEVESQLIGFDWAVISDHCLGSQDLMRILTSASSQIAPREVHVSSELGATKHNNGALFDVVVPDDARGSWVHIGDNPRSDWAFAGARGAQVAKVFRDPVNAWNGHEVDIASLVRDLPAHLGLGLEDKDLVELAVAMYGLITFACELAISEGKQKVAYLSREGQFLSEFHDCTQVLLEKLGAPAIGAVALPASRRSVHAPAGSPNIPNMMRELEIQYHMMTSNEFVQSLGLPEGLSLRVRQSLGPLVHYETSKIWGELTTEIQEEITSYLTGQRELVRAFLEQLEVRPTNTVVCDIGWRGTINDALNSIVNGEFTGAYLGSLFSYRPRGYGKKFGLAIDEPHGLPIPPELTFWGHLERSMTTSSHKALRYIQEPSGVQAEWESADGPGNARLERLDKFRHVYNRVAETLFSAGFFGSDSRDYVRQTLLNWTLEPSFAQADTWFGEHHGEDFGAATSRNGEALSVDQIPNRTGDTWDAETAFLNSEWPEGLLAWLSAKSEGTNR
jgi:hypothetical protein